MNRTFREMAYEWLEGKEGTVRGATYAAYAAALNFNILPILGEKTEVSEADVYAMMDSLERGGIVKSSLRNYVAIVKNVLRYGAEKGYCDYPGWVVSLQSKQSQGGRKGDKLVLLTAAEEQKLVKYFMDNPTPMNLGYFLVLATGMKAGDVLALKWGAMDLQKGMLLVVDNQIVPEADGTPAHRSFAESESVAPANPAPANPEVAVQAPRHRRLPLPEGICAFLRPYKKAAEDYVVTGTSVNLRRPKTFRDSLKAIARNLKLPAVTPQDLRHTFAVRCAQAGCDLVTLMSLLGITEAGPVYSLYGPYFKTSPGTALSQRAGELLNG